MYRKHIKCTMDFCLSFLMLIVLFPIMIVITLLIRLTMGKPVLFKQQRVGKNERIFTIYKFRSLAPDTNEKGTVTFDESRITKLGGFLRATGLDELPELFNILKGDMAIVGPRSLLREYLPYYTETERQRHNVKGGLIPPEVLYNDIMPTWEKQFEYELNYVQNVSFLLDVKILLSAVKGIFTRKKENYGNYSRKPFLEERQDKSL